MSDKKTAKYYQYQGEDGYPVFLKFESAETEQSIKDIVTALGFKKVEENKLKQIPVDRITTKVLTIREASPKVAKEINLGTPGLDFLGPESISARGTYNVYKYKAVGMMVFAATNTLWELGITNTQKNHKEIKVILVRFLSWALASQGIVGLWAVPVEEGVVVMKPIEANHEVVFVDLQNMKLLTQDGQVDLVGGLQFIRLDENLRQQSRAMSKEQVLSFLSTHTTYLSFNGLDYKLKDTIYQLANLFDGVILPVENFKPRATQAA